ncbi:endo-1,4-beta-xylanase [Leptothoe spongobia]|uniref:Endo-1,4-beta-xylanase n=1 Tax=Leptothoe spongobia TAU-MAC 1115 TaxID=1967444 RepID=A0A947GKU2_9CYAN|nr:endo-1,4-beta-xylanase [Leptothoe spongobia]MBT9314561.1 endo-1,4-beta-xylanase [Leptothoe spongobia TAU-MAC 1115]
MQRRQFIYAAGSSLVALQSHRLLYPAHASTDQSFQCRAYLPNGEPLPEASLAKLYFLSLQDEPLPNPERTVENGLLVSQSPLQWPVVIALQLPVAGFGDVTVYADNKGQGFMPGDFPLVLNRAFACDRIARVTQTLSHWQAQGYHFSATIHQTLETAQDLFQTAEHHDTLSGQIRGWNDALSQALWAGENLALSRARQRIARGEPRLDFKFGCNAFAHPSAGPKYDRYFTDLFNYATVPFYWRSFEPEQGNPRFDRVDQQVAWLENAGITPKGHPLVWFHEIGVPNWIREQPYNQVKESLRQRILEIIHHYGDRIPYYDVINEAHGVPWGNELNYDNEQFLDLTRMACDVVREGNPKAQRVVNSCCLWARQVALLGPSVQSPFQYVKACLKANIPFEVIGLQLYYTHQDMFEIDRMLDRFTTFGKPIHITEMSTSSSTGMDENSQLGAARGLWHAPWSETVQADWVEQIYTLAYSKPEVEAVTWWDLSDKNTFWPFGGLLNEANQPKRAYYRLQGLKKLWGLAELQAL